jgi:PAS domain S-box-containing protein
MPEPSLPLTLCGESLLSALREPVLVLDADLRVRQANPPFCRAFALSTNEVLGRPLAEVGGWDFPRLRSLLRGVLAGEPPAATDVEAESDFPGVGRRALLLNARRIVAERGPLVLLALEDVTARKEQARLAEFTRDVGMALAGGESLHDTLGRCAGAMVRHLGAAFARVWVHNADEAVLELRASAGMYTHLDGPHNRVPVGKYKIGLIALERKPHLTNDVPNDPRVSDQAWARREGMIAFAGHPLVVEDRLVGVMALFARQPLSQGCLGAMAAVASEIAVGVERKQAQDALAQQREWFRVTLSSIGDAVIATDTRGRVTFLNDVAESLTGWPSAEAAGRPMEEVFHIVNEQTRRPVENPAEKVLREGHVVGLANHTVLIARDGTERPIDDSAAPIRDARGELCGVVLVFRDVSERHQAEEERQRLAAHLRSLLDSTGEGVYGIDPQGRCTFLNRSAGEMLGYTPEEALGQDMHALIHHTHPDGSPFPAQDCPIYRALHTGQGVWHEDMLWRRDGTGFPARYSSFPILQDGVVRGAVVAFADLTEVRQAERALRDSDARFRRLAGAMPQVVWISGPHGGVEYFNDRWYEYTGLAAEASLGEAWAGALHPEDTGALARWNQAVREGRPFEGEYRLRGRDGSHRWHLARGVPVKDRHGRVLE